MQSTGGPQPTELLFSPLHFVFQTCICRMMWKLCLFSGRVVVVQSSFPKSLYTWSLLKPGFSHWKSLGRRAWLRRPAGETRSFPLDESEWLSHRITSDTAPSRAVLGDCLPCPQINRIRWPGHQLWFLWLSSTYRPGGQAWEAESRVSISCQVSLGSCLGSRAVDTISTKISISLSWEENCTSKRRRIDLKAL